jgi:hypothetical protein
MQNGMSENVKSLIIVLLSQMKMNTFFKNYLIFIFYYFYFLFLIIYFLFVLFF